MSFFLDPPALFILGMLLYHVERGFRWDQRVTMLVEADIVVSVPTMKTHILTGVTMGMKNMYGAFTEENKAKYHRLGIEGVICDVNRAFTPNLTVIDGTVGGEAWGYGWVGVEARELPCVR